MSGVSLPRPSSASRLAGIEGLRAVAACSILVYHSWLYSAPDQRPVRIGRLTSSVPNLQYGVVLFFTLSGFLLYRPFVGSILRGGPLPSVGRYLRNRALRIVPAYIVILLLVSLVLRSAAIRDAAGQRHIGALTNVGVLARNVFLVQDYWPSSTLTGIGPAWSLAVEVVFYLALPLVAAITWLLGRRMATRRGRRVVALVPALLALAVGCSGKLLAAYVVLPRSPFDGWEADWHSVLERSFWCQADLFAFGMVLAVVRIDAEDELARGFIRSARKAAIPLALVAYIATARMTGTREQLSYSFYNTLIAFACACLLAHVVLPSKRPGMLVRLLESRVLVWLGLASYSIFLWHQPLVLWLGAHGLTMSGQSGFAMNTLVLLALTAALSTLTYLLVERPALRHKARVNRAREARVAIGPSSDADHPDMIEVLGQRLHVALTIARFRRRRSSSSDQDSGSADGPTVSAGTPTGAL